VAGYSGAGAEGKDGEDAGSGPIWALGAMSGTSLDGVDAAMILTDGHRVLEFGPHAYRPYTPAEQAVLRAALGRWPGEPGVAAAAEVVETAHAELLSRFEGPRRWAFTARPWRMIRAGGARIRRQRRLAGRGAGPAGGLGFPQL
jgi:anhydro-N-acetylmuramic acid kinase